MGQGNLRPEKQVQVVPNVNGKLVFSHEKLAEGNVIPKGSLLFEVDPVPYESQVQQAQANVRRLEVSIQRQKEQLAAVESRLTICERMLTMAEADFHASETLGAKTYSDTQLHADEAMYLKQKDACVELRSQQRIIPLTISETEAQLDAARAALTQARHDLDNTKINCPFNARVDSVMARAGQYVTALLSMATLTDIESFEIPTIVDPRELKWVHDGVVASARGEDLAEDAPKVTVRWSLFGREFACQGTVRRLERVDETTRAARLVVEIRDVDLGLSSPTDSTRPVVSIGAFCRAEIPARPLHDAIVIPRHAVQEDSFVYVFEPDPRSSDPSIGRLGKRRVTPLRSAKGDVLVRFDGAEPGAVCELSAGDQVVLTPLSKPVVGMPLRRASDTGLATSAGGDVQLARGATSGTSVN